MRRLLLDTHTIIWFINNSFRLPQQIREILEDESNIIYVSIVSLWEISIKFQLRKLDLDRSLGDAVRLLRNNGFRRLPIHLRHIYRLTAMESHHKDPFDRMLIAQALAEGFVLVGCDDVFDLYGVQRLR